MRLLSTTTGESHPLAAVPVFDVPAPEGAFAIFELDRRAEVAISSDIVTLRAGGLAYWATSQVLVWNRRTGELLMVHFIALWALHGD